MEVFNKRGWHIMVLDAQGNYIKDAVKERKNGEHFFKVGRR